MTARLVTPPAAPAVALDAARTAARIDGTDADTEIAQAVRTYTADAEHTTGRAFITQTWSLTLATFPPTVGAAVALPKAPLASVEHINYYDQDNVLRTLDPSAYLVDLATEPGLVAPTPGTSWPATAVRSNAVEIQYTCGYGANDSSVPDPIKGYILAKVQEQFQAAGSVSSSALERLLDGYKVYA